MEAAFIIIIFLLAIYFFFKGRAPSQKKRGLKVRPTAENNFTILQQPLKVKKRYPRPGISRSLIVNSQKFR